MNRRPAKRRAETHDAVTVRLAQMFKLLADETRLRILRRLAEDGEQHVRALCDFLDQSQPAVSHHLAMLKSAGVIEVRRAGKHNYYRVAAPWLTALLDQVTQLAQPAPEVESTSPHSNDIETPRRRQTSPVDDLPIPDYDAEHSTAIEAEVETETEPAELLV